MWNMLTPKLTVTENSSALRGKSLRLSNMFTAQMTDPCTALWIPIFPLPAGIHFCESFHSFIFWICIISQVLEDARDIWMSRTGKIRKSQEDFSLGPCLQPQLAPSDALGCLHPIPFILRCLFIVKTTKTLFGRRENINELTVLILWCEFVYFSQCILLSQ